jgi:DNA-binding HxlR family transcriptional regulator
VKSYQQRCGLALALDRVGDRWTLLIVRELLLGPARYSDLHAALPGAATNLLAQRLRELEATGIVLRSTLPPPAASAVYELTETGRALEEAVLALIRWGGRFLPGVPDEWAFRTPWLVLALRAMLTEDPPARAADPMVVDLVVDDAVVRVRADGGEVAVTAGGGGGGGGDPPAGPVEVDAGAVFAVVSGALGLDEAQERGVARVVGDPDSAARALARFHGARRPVS